MSYIGNQPTSVAFLTDQFSGNASTLVFTMSAAPATTGSILVNITGVTQDPTTYAVSGTTLTFSAAPPTGTGNISVRYLGIPASGVVTTAYRTVTEFTATAGQTSFSVPSYTVGYIDVFRNGVRLGSTDYTATTGTTVVLASGAIVGDLVVTESFYVSSVLNAIPATAGAVNSTYIANGVTLTSPTITSPTISGTVVMGASILTSATAQASTSGTSIDFTGIPSWAKRVTVMFNGVSTNGASPVRIQIGSGSVETSGYKGCTIYTSTAGFVGGDNLATLGAGFDINDGGAEAPTTRQGASVLSLLGSNAWVLVSNLAVVGSTNARCIATNGSKTTSGALDRIRITTVNGTDTFDAGSINIMYE
jgi:hypothetical protein